MLGIPFWFLLISSLARLSAIKIHGSLTRLAKEQGHADTFLQFRPYDFNSHEMARVQRVLAARRPQVGLFAGLQQYESTAMRIEVAPFSFSFSSNSGGSGYSWRQARRMAVGSLLRRHAEQTQRSTLQRLREMGYQAESYWINNSIMIRRAPFNLIMLLLKEAEQDPESEIVAMMPNRIVARIPPMSELSMGYLQRENAQLASHLFHQKGNPSYEDGSSTPWNLQLIRVPKAWERTRGENVTVANIDTGVDFNHPLLRAKYRGMGADLKSVSHVYSWFDPEGLTPFPRDVHGHGTHTIGTMVADEVGVAPAAKWIAAQGCGKQECTQQHLLASAQWVMCPTDQDGQNERCDLGADVVNNSWGGEPTDEESLTWFSATVEAWLAAGMIPIFAQGNSGPLCGTAGTPGDLEKVIAVGAVDRFGSLSFFSSRGPGSSRVGHAKLKPDWVAPGEAIISCRAGDDGIIAMSGTSMAAPHTAGAAALLVSVDPTLDALRFRQLIVETASTETLSEPQQGQLACLDKRWDEFPNYQYGHGLMDVGRAVMIQASIVDRKP